MYAWLDTVSAESTQILTASRRLARTLRREFGLRQVAHGKSAWAVPFIDDWRDWTHTQVSTYGDPSLLPILISPYQSKLLWERCLRREINNPLLSLGPLARQAHETWIRLQEWGVPIAECQRRARNKDQWLFAKAAAAYQSILDNEGWVDVAGVASIATDRLESQTIPTAATLVLCGFDRISPQLEKLLATYRKAGGTISVREPGAEFSRDIKRQMIGARDSDAELRTAGNWAREILDARPDARLAVVVTQLEKDAARSLRLIKEGLIPGWQTASTEQQQLAVNMSYGTVLSEYPVTATALMLLGWLYKDLPTTDVSCLLRSALLGEPHHTGRLRAEMTLRKLPEQSWSPENLLRCLQRDKRASDDRCAGLGFVTTVAEYRRQLPRRQSPSAWVTLCSNLLQDSGWPGEASLQSAEFQTVNRWRELLNEVARLELVNDSMTVSEVCTHIAAIAAETLFQPEGKDAAVHVLGPLEAAGLEFDAVWVTGASNTNWPPQARPSALVSRDLQREFSMPDAVPADTLQYAQRVLYRLANCASAVVFSYPVTQADSLQAPSGLLEGYKLPAEDAGSDPGWYAAQLVNAGKVTICHDDPVPAAATREVVHGGAATVQRQFVEPFAAFATGRLGIQFLWPIEPGLAANIRGSLIHDALHRLYVDCPTQQQIQNWNSSDVAQRIAKAVAHVFRRYEAYADRTLAQLLVFEKERVARLLRQVIEHDVSRDAFEIAAVEQGLAACINGLNLYLRIDRIDRDAAGDSLVIDYKTGSVKRLLDRDKHPKDMQLIVYARALEVDTAGIALLNIDTRGIEFDAVGRDYPARLDWDAVLPEWFAEIDAAAGRIAGGDIRINGVQAVKESRPLGLLSRIRELQLDQ